MTNSDRLTMCETMCESDALSHLTALVEENHQRNHMRYRIGQASPVRRVGIVGAGYMGSVVAASAVGQSVSVVITDQDTRALAGAKQAIRKAMRSGRLNSSGDIDERVAKFVTVTPDLADVAACDFVVEAIVENLNCKRILYAELGRLCQRRTIIASNTSTLPITELSAGLCEPERFCGLHYFPTIGGRTMLEIIPGEQTSDAVTSRVIQFSEQLGSIPLVVSDGRGFLVNRILTAYMSAGMRLLAMGVDIKAIDSTAMAFGMRMGPIRLYDEVGLDVALHCGWSLSADSDTLVARSPTIIRMIKANQLGCKSGRGFFIHEVAGSSERVGDVNPKALQIIESQIESRVDLARAEIEAAVTLPMVIEATRLLEIERAHSAWQVDLAIMCGFGFPALRGGPLCWADQVGSDRIVETLESLRHLGSHLCPTQSLLRAAQRRVRFYDRSNVAVDSSSTVRNAS